MSMEMLANRVRKTARHLAKWARREGIACYRIYDRDIPEVPITIDTYAGALVMNDYRLEQGDAAWLDAAAAAARDALGATEVFVKSRERLVDRQLGHQYEKLDDAGARREVTEGGHRFLVNLGDYVDTGLFLDHRVTRARVAAEPGTRMLNLFAYTGAFSVYAAAAGKETTSVDLSRTYLDWAAANLALNKLRGEIVQLDVRELLAGARKSGRRWDVAIVDPPTFSNSKRMDYTWDVQRDHVALLDDVASVMAPGGVIWFSTNKKKFRFDWTHKLATVTDETHATTPPDFHHKPHRAYRIAWG
jgi:23S rRNA G2069 N7-methylase RlmK/C1962 C5-methylase RlmI